MTHRIRWRFINDPPAHMNKTGVGLPMTHAQAVAGFRKLMRENKGILYSVEPVDDLRLTEQELFGRTRE